MKLQEEITAMQTILKAVLGTAIVLGAGGYGLAYAGPVPGGYTCLGGCGTDAVPDGNVPIPPSGDTTVLYVTTTGGLPAPNGQIAGGYPVGNTNGSLLTSPTFTAAAGAPLTFYFDYTTSDGSGFPDYAWSQLYTSGGTLVATLFTAATQPSGNISPGQGLPANQATLTPPTSAIIPGQTTWSALGSWSGACYLGVGQGCGTTGWIQSTYDIANAGSYYVEFGATNANDTLYDSGLAIDGLAVSGTPITGTPEPASMALLGAALIGFGVIRRRQRTA